MGEEDIRLLEIRENLHDQRRATKLEEIEVCIGEHLNELSSKEQQFEFIASVESVIASYRKKLSHVKPVNTAEAASTNVTMVPMKPREGSVENLSLEKPISKPITTFRLRESDNMTARHNKGTRVRGCPCCDPDNLDNVVDSYLFLQPPP